MDMSEQTKDGDESWEETIYKAHQILDNVGYKQPLEYAAKELNWLYHEGQYSLKACDQTPENIVVLKMLVGCRDLKRQGEGAQLTYIARAELAAEIRKQWQEHDVVEDDLPGSRLQGEAFRIFSKSHYLNYLHYVAGEGEWRRTKNENYVTRADKLTLDAKLLFDALCQLPGRIVVPTMVDGVSGYAAGTMDLRAHLRQMESGLGWTQHTLKRQDEQPKQRGR